MDFNIKKDSSDIFSNRIRLLHHIKGAKKRLVLSTHQESIVDNIFNLISKDEKSEFISLEDNNNISFAKKKEDIFNKNNRKTISFNSFIMDRMNISVANPHELLDKIIRDVYLDDAFSNVLILNNFDIEKLFSKLGTSKLIEKSKLDFYVINSNKVSIVITTAFVRAILWTCDDGTKILDKIYPRDKKDILLDWAQKNKIIAADISGIDIKPYKITMKYTYGPSKIPYQDTFKYGEIQNLELNKCNTIILSADSDFGNVLLDSNVGALNRPGICDICKINSEKTIITSIFNKKYCPACLKVRFRKCNHCNDYNYINENSFIEPLTDNKDFIINGGFICSTCIKNEKKDLEKECLSCKREFIYISMYPIYSYGNINYFCKKCAIENVKRCCACNAVKFTKKIGDKNLCVLCAESYNQCQFCDRFVQKHSLGNIKINNVLHKNYICNDCQNSRVDIKKCRDCWTSLYQSDYFIVDTESLKNMNGYSYITELRKEMCKECAEKPMNRQLKFVSKDMLKYRFRIKIN